MAANENALNLLFQGNATVNKKKRPRGRIELKYSNLSGNKFFLRFSDPFLFSFVSLASLTGGFELEGRGGRVANNNIGGSSFVTLVCLLDREGGG